MHYWLKWREALLATFVWLALTLADFALRGSMEAALLVWLPAGVLVAVLNATPRSRWPGALAVMLIVQATVYAWHGTTLTVALASAIAAVVQSVVCASLGIRVMRGRREVPRRTREIAGLFAAALAGCALGALIAFPTRPEPDLFTLSWWFLANVLGIVIGTPVFLFLRSLLRAGPISNFMQADRWFCLVLAMAALACWIILRSEPLYLLPVLLSGMVFAAVRYGEPAPALIVLAFALAATINSVGGLGPAPLIHNEPKVATLILQAWMLLMLATAMPIAAVMLKRDRLQAELEARNARLHDSLEMFDLAEDLAGIGRWRYDLRDGSQEWSMRMLEMCGLAHREPGEMRNFIPDNGDMLSAQLQAHREHCETWRFNYRVKQGSSGERILRVSMRNEFDAHGTRVAVFAVAMDITAQVRREEALDLARGRAVRLAAQAQKLANTDPLTGLPNRRCSLARLNGMIDAVDRTAGCLAVIMFDIDRFKQVNDGHGHKTGDDVLVRLAKLAGTLAHRGELVGRIGGEEFVWLLPGLEAHVVSRRAEMLRALIEGESGRDGLPNVTASIGLAYYREGDDADGILARADRALYAAKAGGRNRVRLAA